MQPYDSLPRLRVDHFGSVREACYHRNMRHLLIAQILGAVLFAIGLGGFFLADWAPSLLVAGIGALFFMIAAILSRMKSDEP